MKICVVSPSYLPDKTAGGAVTGCHEFVKTISLVCSVEVVSFDTLNDKVRERTVDHISVQYLKKSSFFDFMSSHGWHFSVDYLLFIFRRFKDFDCIYFRSIWNFPSLVGFIYCYIIGKKFIFCSSGKLSEWALRKSLVKKSIVLFLVRPFLKKASAIHYASEQEYLRVKSKTFSNIRPLVIPTSIDIPEFNVEAGKSNNTSLDGSFKLYTVSRLHIGKNINFILDELMSFEKEVKFHIIGDGEQNFVSALKNKAFDLEVKNPRVKIIFEGFQNKNWIDENMSGALYLQASFSEGYSNSIVEALARRSFAIVSKGCIMKEFADRQMLDEFDLEKGELKQLILKYYRDTTVHTDISQKCVEFLQTKKSKQYLSQQFAKQIQEII